MDTEAILENWRARGYSLPEGELGEARCRSYIREVKEEILGYCNLPAAGQVPQGLFYLWAKAAYRRLCWGEQKAMAQGQGAGGWGAGTIRSLKQGDSSVSFGGNAGSGLNGEVLAEEFTQQERALMNRFRRFK